MQICYHAHWECLHPYCGHSGQSAHLAYLRLYLNQQHRESEFAHNDDKILNCLIQIVKASSCFCDSQGGLLSLQISRHDLLVTEIQSRALADMPDES